MRNTLLLFIVLLAPACSTINVKSTDSVDGFKLSNYKTFDFYQLEAGGDTSANFSSNVEVLKKSITKQLEARGLKQSTTNPDLLVNLGIVVEEKIQTRETTIRDAHYMGQRNYSWKSEEIEVGRYKDGTVSVHLVDPAKKSLVWQGVVESIVPSNKSKVPATIDEGMTVLFTKVP